MARKNIGFYTFMQRVKRIVHHCVEIYINNKEEMCV